MDVVYFYVLMGTITVKKLWTNFHRIVRPAGRRWEKNAIHEDYPDPNDICISSDVERPWIVNVQQIGKQ